MRPAVSSSARVAPSRRHDDGSAVSRATGVATAAIAVLGAITISLAVEPLGAEAAQSSRAVSRTERAVKYISDNRPTEALKELDLAIEDDPEYWEAHYQRGRLLGQMQRMDEALPSLLRATELNPAMAHAHELAAIAAWETDEYEVAWDQVIQAHLGGAQVEERIQRMAGVRPPPDDFMERITAPRGFVLPLDLEEIQTRAELPFDRNAQVRDDENRSGIPENILGRDLAIETAAEQVDVLTAFSNALADSRVYGVVSDPRLAEYMLRISVDELAERPPRRMEGFLDLVGRESGISGYRTAFTFRDIGSKGVLRGEIARLVDDMGDWLRKLRASQ